jgi:hypothetical protein
VEPLPAIGLTDRNATMAKGMDKKGKNDKKPKKEKPKVIAAAPSTKNSVTIAGTKTKT